MIPPEQPDMIASAAANKAVGAGSAVTVFGWAAASDFGIWIGILIGLCGLFMNFHYQRRSDRRAAEAHDMYMARIVRTSNTEDATAYNDLQDKQS